MDRRSMKDLRLDRRLARRPGWISEEELARELESLPDVSHKVAEESPEEAAPGDAPEAPVA